MNQSTENAMQNEDAMRVSSFGTKRPQVQILSPRVSNAENTASLDCREPEREPLSSGAVRVSASLAPRNGLRVLVACEYSGAVRDAFTAAGHYARSVDLLPTEANHPVRFRHEFGCMNHAEFDPTCEDCEHDEPYCHRCDCFAFECACLGPTEDEAEYTDPEHGARHLTGDLFSLPVGEILSYDLLIAHPPCTHLAVSGARWLTRHFVKRKSGGYWHDPSEKLRLQSEAVEFVQRIWALPIAMKCLENPISRLSTLWQKPTQIIQPWQFGHGETKATCLWLEGLPKLVPTNIVAGREQRIHYLPPSPDRWKERSRTFAGIAAAMADQWGSRGCVREAVSA